MRILLFVLLIVSFPAFSLNECGNRSRPGNYHELENLDIGLKNMGEVKATDLDWKDGSKLPKEASKYIEKHAQISINQFALFDLNKDGIDEIIIMSSSLGGSGGAGFMFL